MAGCGDTPTAFTVLTRTEGVPFAQGRLERSPMQADDWGYLVLAPSEPGTDPVGAYFHVGPETRLVWADGGAAPEAALQAGRWVSVWVDPRYPILESQPPSIAVRTVMVHGRAPR